MIQARFEDMMTIAVMQGEGADPWEIVDALPYPPPQARSVLAVCTGVITSDNEVGSAGWAEMMTWLTDSELAEIGIDRQEVIDDFEERYGPRSFMAAEFQEHLHPRGRGGKWVKKIVSAGPRPTGMDALLPPEKLKLLTDIPLGARVRVTRKESGYVREGILFRRRFDPNANQQTIGILATDEDTGEIQGPINLAFDQMEIERLDDGPVDLATLREKTLATLDPWEAPPKPPDLVPPPVPDDFFAKRYRKMAKGYPSDPPITDADFKKGGRFDWLNHPDTYEFQRAKQLAQTIQMEIGREWAVKWFKETHGSEDIGQYTIANEPQMSTKRLPDWVRPINPEFTQWLWGKFVEDKGLENHPEPTNDSRWQQRFSDWLTFQSTRDLLSNAVRYGHYGSYVDNEDEVHRTAVEALKPIFNDENMQGVHIWGAGSSVQFPSGMIPVFEGWDEETKSWSSIRWKDAEPGWEMAMVLTPTVSPSQYWYESHTGQYASLSIVPSERAVAQETKVRSFGRLVFESNVEAIESDPETAKVRASIAAIDKKVDKLREKQRGFDSGEGAEKRRTAAQKAFDQIWVDLKKDFPDIADTEMNPDEITPSFLIGIIARHAPAERKAEYNSRVTDAILLRDRSDGVMSTIDISAKMRELGHERSLMMRQMDGIKRKHWRETMASMGIEMADEIQEHYPPGEGPNIALDIPNNDLPALRSSQSAYPKAWIEASNRRGSLAQASVSTGDKYYGRGFYRDYGVGAFSQGPGTIWLPRRSVPSIGEWGKEPEHVGVHELGHRMEYTIPGITAMEAAFHYSRTKNDKVQMYANDEWVKPDQFVNNYSGKLYQGDSWEVFTMAMQSLYPYSSMEGIDDRQWEQDPDYLALAAGLVALR